MTKRILRGVQDIKTFSGRADEGAMPYKAYMKLSILEMEKFRRGKEKQSALDRVDHIDQRFKDIETERREIMTILESKGFRPQRSGAPEEPPQSSSRITARPFKIRY